MAMAQPQQTSFVFTTERTFDAPREWVWKAWTDANEMKKWFGPKGATVPFCEVDLRPGGASRYGMEFNGMKMWGQWKYKEIKAPEKIVAIVSFLDEKGNIVAHPGSPNWPREVLSTVTFTEVGNQTKIHVDWVAHNATEVERRTFEEGAQDMQMGWGGTFDQLADYLARK